MNELLFQRVKKIAKTDIHQIVSEYTKLTAKGRDYHGNCPFCKKEQKLAIAPSYGMFYCFGCQRGGDPIVFLQIATGKDKEEIAKELSVKYGVNE